MKCVNKNKSFHEILRIIFVKNCAKCLLRILLRPVKALFEHVQIEDYTRRYKRYTLSSKHFIQQSRIATKMWSFVPKFYLKIGSIPGIRKIYNKLLCE